MLFVRDDIAFNVREDLSHQDVLLPRTKPILICICYRPPKQTNFYSLLEEQCQCQINSDNLHRVPDYFDVN